MKWTNKEVEILKQHYNKMHIDEICELLKPRTKQAIQSKASLLRICNGKHSDDIKRFWKYVDKKSNEKCWNWIGTYNDEDGYGRIYMYKANVLAHRFSWIIHKGDIPDGLLVCHHCDNPSCVNPYHLFLGTIADNNKDRDDKNRQVSNKGEKHGCSKLTNIEVRKIKKLKGMLSQTQIGKLFNVHKSIIGKIYRNEIWKHIQ